MPRIRAISLKNHLVLLINPISGDDLTSSESVLLWDVFSVRINMYATRLFAQFTVKYTLMRENESPYHEWLDEDLNEQREVPGDEDNEKWYDACRMSLHFSPFGITVSTLKRSRDEPIVSY